MFQIIEIMVAKIFFIAFIDSVQDSALFLCLGDLISEIIHSEISLDNIILCLDSCKLCQIHQNKIQLKNVTKSAKFKDLFISR